MDPPLLEKKEGSFVPHFDLDTSQNSFPKELLFGKANRRQIASC
jgi:hypothetical protein